MDEDVDWTLLGKYLFGECSEEEASRVQRWIEQNPKRRVLLGQLRKVLWATEESPSAEDLGAQALWERIDRETREDENRGASSTRSSDREPGSSRSRRRRAPRPRSKESSLRKMVWTGSLAALITVTAVLWLFGPLESGLQGSSDQAPKTFETQKGQRTSLRLPDGSQVRLNVDSRLTVPPTFEEEKRVVRLEGEAFFSVKADSARPFVVRSGKTVTRVLGTAFNVGAYPKEDEIKVAVAEGRVHLRTEKPPEQKPGVSPSGDGAPRGAREDREDEEPIIQKREDVVLTKNQVSLISRSGDQTTWREEDLSEHLAWIDGKLAFEDAPFEEVTRKLERWYGLEITLQTGTSPPPGHLNAQFAEDRALGDVLRVIDVAFGLKHSRDESRVTFTDSR